MRCETGMYRTLCLTYLAESEESILTKTLRSKTGLGPEQLKVHKGKVGVGVEGREGKRGKGGRLVKKDEASVSQSVEGW